MFQALVPRGLRYDILHSMTRRRSLFMRIMRSGPVLGVLIVIAAFTSYAAVTEYQNMRQQRAEVQEIREEKQHLADRYDRLQHELKELQTPHGKEVTIRQKYSVTKNGEHMVVIVDNDRSEDTKAATTSDDDPWWTVISSWF